MKAAWAVTEKQKREKQKLQDPCKNQASDFLIKLHWSIALKIGVI